ncbi:GspE/PulE family protein [Paraglaciecola sp.]|uniref:GspE/PulE family protein n=1 Tax=Paraglaciecola sp. TaxID=1920173 RepID=UPI003EF0D295
MQLNDLLVQKFHVDLNDLGKAEEYQKRYGGRIEQVLVNMGSLPDDRLPELYSEYLNLARLDVTDWIESPLVDLDKELINTILSQGWVPLSNVNDELVLACKDPLALELNEFISCLPKEASVVVGLESEIVSLAARYNNENGVDELIDFSDEEDKLREMATEAPTVNLLNSLISRALRQGASDMHLEPFENRYRARYRVDGVLHEAEVLSPRMQLPIVTRLKILSGMDIAERRRPQDGKIEMRIANQELDIRVSSLPLNEGESMVLRFLRKDSVRYDMSVLGLSNDIHQLILEDLKRTSGVVLLTGPTGSGKTTTLYTFLNALNSDNVKIITLEDPVEYQMDGINQVQINSDIGFTFSNGLRSVVRQDPDIIMLGEIRDNETAQIALQSALTGHLVFSTVHTNDAAGAYTRLLDLGVEEFLLNAALVSVVAQRLARKNCQHCIQPHPEASKIIEEYQLQGFADRFGIAEINLVQGQGCDNCADSGYKGRLAITEYLRCDDTIKAMPKNADFINHAKAHNASLKRRTLLEDGLLKAVLGETTIDEVIRVAG